MPDADLQRLEERFLNSMSVPEQLMYDGWLLRFAPNDVKRTRSINVLHEYGLPLEEKLDYCEMFHLGYGQAPLYRLTSLDSTDIDDALAGRRYERFDESYVQVATLREGLTPAPAELWFETVDARRFVQQLGDLRGLSDAAQAAHLRRLTFSPLPQFRLLAWRGDELLGAALSIREDEWVGLFDVHVLATERRQGVGTASARPSAPIFWSRRAFGALRGRGWRLKHRTPRRSTCTLPSASRRRMVTGTARVPSHLPERRAIRTIRNNEQGNQGRQP